MNRDLKYLANDPKEREFVEEMKYGTNTTTIQLTLIAALEAAIPNVSTRGSINLHIIGADIAEFASVPAFEELLHFFPSLTALHVFFVGLNVIEGPKDDPRFHNPRTLQCCTMCTKMGREISITTWRGPYHAFINTKFYKTPDLAAAFHSGFWTVEEEIWLPTIIYLARAPHPTLFTSAIYSDIPGEMKIWESLGTEFVKTPEINKWKGMCPRLEFFGKNEVNYINYWWYIVKQR